MILCIKKIYDSACQSRIKIRTNKRKEVLCQGQTKLFTSVFPSLRSHVVEKVVGAHDL